MSATEQEIQPETGLITRSFAGEMTAGDGRTIDVRIVPYNVEATVSVASALARLGLALEDD